MHGACLADRRDALQSCWKAQVSPPSYTIFFGRSALVGLLAPVKAVLVRIKHELIVLIVRLGSNKVR